MADQGETGVHSMLSLLGTFFSLLFPLNIGLALGFSAVEGVSAFEEPYQNMMIVTAFSLIFSGLLIAFCQIQTIRGRYYPRVTIYLTFGMVLILTFISSYQALRIALN